MSKWILAVGLVAGAGMWLSTALRPTRADSASANLGRKVAGFELRAVGGKTVSLAEFKDRKAIVGVFVGTQCPINNAFMPRLAELHQEYAARGVQVLAINSNRQDTLDRMAEHARKHAIPFPVLKDEGNRVADQFGARRTPEAFVLDATGTIRY